MSTGGIRVQVSAEVMTKTRVQVLGSVARRLAASAGLPEAHLKIVEQSIVKRMLAEFEVVLHGAPDRPGGSTAIGYLRVRIDWERYAATLLSPHGSNTFELDVNQELTSQISPILGHLNSYIEATCARLPVTHRQVAFTPRPGMTSEFDKEFDTRHMSEKAKAELQEARDSTVIDFSPRQLNEVSVVFGHIHLD